MIDLAVEVEQAIKRVRVARTDLHSIEVKNAIGGAPKSLPETISAFANGDGGLIILGLDEKANLTPTGADAQRLAESLITACSDAVEPAIRAEVDIVQVDGVPVAAAFVPPVAASRRPCFVRTQGLERGSYIRGHDGDRHLTTYEIHILLADRGQPRDDVAVVTDATFQDLDKALVARLIERLRRTRGPVFQSQDDMTILRMVGVLAPDKSHPTLAGLLSLGIYPQQFLPQLNITLVAFPTADGRPMADGTRFLDNVSIDGAIPQMIDIAQRALIRNMTRGAVITGAGREDIWEFPLEAVRELIVNAIMHRDYHPLAQGTQIRIELYPDRLTVTNPGGLFGTIDPDMLMHSPITSSRNNNLSKLLEDIEMPNSPRTVAENRGSGLISVSAELARADMPQARISASISHFTIELLKTQPSPKGMPTAPTASSNTPSNTHLTPRQMKVFQLLKEGDAAAAELSETLGVSRQAIQKHLASLESKGLVEPTSNSRRSKRTLWHRITETTPQAA